MNEKIAFSFRRTVFSYALQHLFIISLLTQIGFLLLFFLLCHKFPKQVVSWFATHIE